MRKYFTALMMTILIVVAIGACVILRNNLYSLRGAKDSYARFRTEERPYIDEEFLEFYGLSDFETTLPVLYIETENDDDIININESVWTSVSILNADNDGTSHKISEVPDLKIPALVKNRGASSKNFDKKQYRIEFHKKQGGNGTYDYDLLGMGESSDWVLHGPFLDKTLLRNYLVYTLASETMEWAPECRFIELFCDGKYQGVYLAEEPVSNGAGRLRLSTFGLLTGECAYIVGRDRVGTDYSPLKNYGRLNGYTSNSLYIDYPGRGSLTDENLQWITDDISKFEEVLYGDDFADPKTGYAAYIDVDNFVNYAVINEFALNHDAGLLSTYAYKELHGKLKMVCWDYNNAFDNYQWFPMKMEKYNINEAPWFDRLLEDPAFVEKVSSRYHELRKTTLSEEHIQEVIDQGQLTLGDAVDRNFAVWGYTYYLNLMSDDDAGVDRDSQSYDEAMTKLNDAISKRLLFMDEHIEDIGDKPEE